MIADINRRRDYVKTLMMGTGQTDKAISQLPHILPDYMLVFAVPVLAHNPSFTKWDDIEELTKAKQCLWFILEPLVVKNDYFSYGFYKNLIEKMKNHKDAVSPMDDSTNYVSVLYILLIVLVPTSWERNVYLTFDTLCMSRDIIRLILSQPSFSGSLNKNI